MLGGVPLIIFCAGKILLDDFYGVPKPNAGFCGGTSGLDCVCQGGVPSGTAAEFTSWYGSLDGLEGELPSVDAEVGFDDDEEASAKPEGYDLDQDPNFFAGDDEENDVDGAEVEADGTVNGAEAAGRQRRKPPPIKVLEDGSRILFNADTMQMMDGEDISACVDKNDNCTWWAEIGECYKNPGYLIQNCPKACNYCRAALPEAVRCQRDTDALPLVQSPGGLNAMFQAIVDNQEFTDRYNTTVVSREPWILQFDNFAEPGDWEELDLMLDGKFEGSTVVGAMTDDGKIGRQHLSTRTSRNAWCMQSPCLHSRVHVDLQNRLTDLLGVGSPAYMESLQVLKYQVGQFYNTHHDTILDQIQMMSGPRMLTAFIYFNEVEGGGETDFPRVGVKVKPAPGRMVLWPSQKDSDSMAVDDRTYHEACNVTAGFKYAANLWVHLYDYQTPYVMGCAG